jgi:hypothetical protein
MPPARLETTIPVFEWAKTVHSSDRTATVIGDMSIYLFTYLSTCVPNYVPKLGKVKFSFDLIT